MKKYSKALCTVICLILVLLLLSACTQGEGEVTTGALTTPAPESTSAPEETTSPETDEVTTEAPEETTTPETETDEVTTSAPETTVTPEIYEAYVYFHLPSGEVEKVTLKPETTIPSAYFEAQELPETGDGVRVEHKGWEYSITEGGERRAYDLSSPPLLTLEGMHIYPVLEYSYRVSFSAGEGAFPEGTQTEFYLKAGESVDASALLTRMPEIPESGRYYYSLVGFSADGKDVVQFPISLEAPVSFTAIFVREEIRYSLLIHTEYGELIGGGTTLLVNGTASELEAVLDSYADYKPADVHFGDYLYRFRGLEIESGGREWTLELLWERVTLRYEVTLDRGDGNGAELIGGLVGEKIVLPVEETREDKERYYVFVGWRDQNGQLYNGGYELTVSGDVAFTAEFVPGERKVYTILFDTEIGFFGNGAPDVIITGHYGDPLVPPAPPSGSELVFGEVVYTFVGWSEDVSETIVSNAVYTAVFSTEHPVYYLEYYVNGELYLRIPHYEGTALELIPRPEDAAGKIFSGWEGLPAVMPAENVRLDATVREAKVIYMLDGEILQSTAAPIGSLVTIAAPAVKQGFTVSGWTTTDITLTDGASFIMPEGDVCFSAISTPNIYTVTYVIDGVTLYTDSVYFGDLYTVRGIEVRTGYDFSGWRSDSILIGEDGIVIIPDRNIVFIGSFTPLSYSVNYYIEGELVYREEYLYGATVTVRPDEVQEGCTFFWSSAGADLSEGSFVMPAHDVDIYGAFSDGDNKIVFIVDGVHYGELGVSAGQLVELSLMPTRSGYTFTGWSCDEVDVSEGVFVMPEGDIILRGSFVPNAHNVIFIDMATGNIIGMSNLDYGSAFSLGDRVYCTEGMISTGWVLIAGDAIRNGEEYIMPDEDVVFGIVWESCLTLMLEEDYWIPYYALIYEELDGFRYDAETKTLYVTDPSARYAGESEGVSVVIEYISE